MGKGTNSGQQPKPAGLDELDVATAETDVPHTYFAGVRKLAVTWICYPVIVHTTNVPSGGKGK